MAKPVKYVIFFLEQIPKDFAWAVKLVDLLNRFCSEVAFALNKRLTFSENTTSDIITFRITQAKGLPSSSNVYQMPWSKAQAPKWFVLVGLNNANDIVLTAPNQTNAVSCEAYFKDGYINLSLLRGMGAITKDVDASILCIGG